MLEHAHHAVDDLFRGRVWMRLSFAKIDDVRHFYAAHFQEIGNQSAMAMPPKRFCAHDRSWSHFRRKIDKTNYAFPKLFRLHVIGVTAKRFVAPGGVA